MSFTTKNHPAFSLGHSQPDHYHTSIQYIKDADGISLPRTKKPFTFGGRKLVEKLVRDAKNHET